MKAIVSAENLKKEWIDSWPSWWKALPLWRKLLPALSALTLWGGLALLGGLRQDHWNIGIAILLLGYGGKHANTILKFLLPLILTGVVYDTQRYYADWIRGSIRVEEPYFFDKRFFGISTPEGVLTPNEWLQKHTSAILDLISGLAYLVFILIFVLQAAWYRFKLKIQNSEQMMWAFFWVNVIGYSTYYWYPAAPPWYVALYGLGPAKMDTPANPAGCIRFDELLGTHFFTGMYGRAADVFGAIPSLHVAYPLIGVFYAFLYKKGRVFSLLFYLLMCFSAVYLNHHYVLDILWGSAYAGLIFTVIRLTY